MKLYDGGVIVCAVIAFVAYGLGYIIYGKATEKPAVDTNEQMIIQQGYVKTNYTEEQALYSDYQECIEYKHTLYCY